MSNDLFNQPIIPGKYCRKCQKTKPYDDFPWRWQDGRKTRYYQCRKCTHAQKRRNTKLRMKTTAKGKAARRKRDLSYFHGLNHETYEQLLAAQNGKCAICGEIETEKRPDGILKKLAVDHCHSTMKIRGLLCRRCNQILGHLKDNPELLRKAATYLETASTGLQAKRNRRQRHKPTQQTLNPQDEKLSASEIMSPAN